MQCLDDLMAGPEKSPIDEPRRFATDSEEKSAASIKVQPCHQFDSMVASIELTLIRKKSLFWRTDDARPR